MPIDDGMRAFNTEQLDAEGKTVPGPIIEALDWNHACQIGGEMGGVTVTGERRADWEDD